VIREDPHNRDLLFVGSSRSAYVSIDRGQNWTRFATNFPSVPVYDLQIHPRDHELIAATHGRSLWIADIAALEQMTPKVIAQGTYLFAPKTAYQWGEGPQPGLPGNGYAQAVMTYANSPYGADIVYRLAAVASGPVRLVVSNAAGDTLANLNGPATPGVHHVTWDFQQAAPRRLAALSPSQRRDSILLRARAPQVLDSLTKAGYDTAAIRVVRAQVNVLVNPQQAAGGGRGGRGGAGGGGGGRGGGGGQACEHPTTQWEQFCARPAESVGGRGGGGGGAFGGLDSATTAALTPPAGGGGGGGGRGGRGGRGGNAQGAMGDAGLDPIGRIWSLIGMTAPSFGGRGGGGGGGGGGGAGGATTANTGDYLVSMVVNGQTYKQLFRVERVSGGGSDNFQFGEDENHDQGGRYVPKVPKNKSR
jgi:hypothetical protein